MVRLRWLLIGIATTAFSADYLRMKAQWREMASVATLAEAVSVRSQATTNACLVELAYNKSMIETWEVKTKLITTAKMEALHTIDRAKDGDAEAVAALKDMGYSVSSQGKKIVQMRYGIGGP